MTFTVLHQTFGFERACFIYVDVPGLFRVERFILCCKPLKVSALVKLSFLLWWMKYYINEVKVSD